MQEKEINLIDYWNLLWANRKFIIITVSIVTILAVIISLLLPKWYKATSVIMPPATEEGQFGRMSANLGAFGLGGMLDGNENQMRLLTILKSRKTLELLDQKFDFQKKYDERFKFKTYGKIKSNLYIGVGEEEQIIFSFFDEDQDLVADIVNYVTHCLDSLNISLSTSKGKNNREFIENRMQMVQDTLVFTENEISDFMEDNNLISITEQTKAVVEKAADMKAQIMAKEIELEVMKSRLTSNSEAIANSEVTLKLIKDKYKTFFDNSEPDELFINLGNIPIVQKKFAQLKRKEFYYTKLLEYLGPQYEQAKIEEAKDVPTIQVIDKAKRPEWKSKPKRALIVLFSMLTSLLVIILFLIIHNTIKEYNMR